MSLTSTNFFVTVRFENEELEVKTFVEFMKAQQPDAFSEFEGTTLEEILVTLKETTVLWSKNDVSGCDCKSNSVNNVISRNKRDHDSHKRVSPMQQEENRASESMKNENDTVIKDTIYQMFAQLEHTIFARYMRVIYETISSKLFDLFTFFSNFTKIKHLYANSLLWQTTSQFKRENDANLAETSPSSSVSFNNSFTEKSIVRTRRAAISNKPYGKPYLDVFVFSVNVDLDNFYVVAKFKNLSDAKISTSHLEDEITKTAYYEEYERIHVLSLGIKYAGFGILTLMLAEVGVVHRLHAHDTFN